MRFFCSASPVLLACCILLVYYVVVVREVEKNDFDNIPSIPNKVVAELLDDFSNIALANFLNELPPLRNLFSKIDLNSEYYVIQYK